MITVKALKAFSDGELSMHDGEIRDIDETKATQYIAEGYVIEYTEPIVPQGKITITENETDIDVSQYALADVSVSGGAPMCKLTVLADGAGSVTANTLSGSVIIYDNIIQNVSVSIVGDSVDIYSPYAYLNSTYIVSYFSKNGYNTEADAIASVTNLNNISVIAYQDENEFWYIILAVTDQTLPSSATIPCESK